MRVEETITTNSTSTNSENKNNNNLQKNEVLPNIEKQQGYNTSTTTTTTSINPNSNNNHKNKNKSIKRTTIPSTRNVASGISNLGNTCYMNAILQALAHSPELCMSIENEGHILCGNCSVYKENACIRMDMDMANDLEGGGDMDKRLGMYAGMEASMRAEPTTTNTSKNNKDKQKKQSNHMEAQSKKNKLNHTEQPSNNNSPPSLKYCLSCEFEKHIANVHTQSTSTNQSIDKTTSVKDFVYGFMDHIAPQFRIGVQEDSHEFLRLLIDAMQKSSTTVQLEDNKKLDASPSKCESESTYPFFLFRGVVESTVICMECKAISKTSDPIEDLGLEVLTTNNSHSNNHSTTFLSDVNAAMELFTKQELLEGYKCNACTQKGNATKQNKLASVPPILTLHLKRFRYGPLGSNGGGMNGSGNGNSRRGSGGSNTYLNNSLGSSVMGSSTGSAKIEEHVKFEQIFDISPYTTPSYQSKHPHMFCRLFAVVVHSGRNSHSGHYFVYVRNIQKNEWWKMDDSAVSRVSAGEVMDCQAYILFYRVVDHPSLIHLKEKAVRNLKVREAQQLRIKSLLCTATDSSANYDNDCSSRARPGDTKLLKQPSDTKASSSISNPDSNNIIIPTKSPDTNKAKTTSTTTTKTTTTSSKPSNTTTPNNSSPSKISSSKRTNKSQHTLPDKPETTYNKKRKLRKDNTNTYKFTKQNKGEEWLCQTINSNPKIPLQRKLTNIQPLLNKSQDLLSDMIQFTSQYFQSTILKEANAVASSRERKTKSLVDSFTLLLGNGPSSVSEVDVLFQESENDGGGTKDGSRNCDLLRSVILQLFYFLLEENGNDENKDKDDNLKNTNSQVIQNKENEKEIDENKKETKTTNNHSASSLNTAAAEIAADTSTTTSDDKNRTQNITDDEKNEKIENDKEKSVATTATIVATSTNNNDDKKNITTIATDEEKNETKENNDSIKERTKTIHNNSTSSNIATNENEAKKKSMQEEKKIDNITTAITPTFEDNNETQHPKEKTDIPTHTNTIKKENDITIIPNITTTFIDDNKCLDVVVSDTTSTSKDNCLDEPIQDTNTTNDILIKSNTASTMLVEDFVMNDDGLDDIINLNNIMGVSDTLL